MTYRHDWSYEDEWRWLELRKQAFERDDYHCKRCGTKVKTPVADHIVPIVDGGVAFDINNIQTLCGHCNRTKTRNDDLKRNKLKRLQKMKQKQSEIQ